jgi:hypothetical protein
MITLVISTAERSFTITRLFIVFHFSTAFSRVTHPYKFSGSSSGFQIFNIPSHCLPHTTVALTEKCNIVGMLSKPSLVKAYYAV